MNKEEILAVLDIEDTSYTVQENESITADVQTDQIEVSTVEFDVSVAPFEQNEIVETSEISTNEKVSKPHEHDLSSTNTSMNSSLDLGCGDLSDIVPEYNVLGEITNSSSNYTYTVAACVEVNESNSGNQLKSFS